VKYTKKKSSGEIDVTGGGGGEQSIWERLAKDKKDKPQTQSLSNLDEPVNTLGKKEVNTFETPRTQPRALVVGMGGGEIRRSGIKREEKAEGLEKEKEKPMLAKIPEKVHQGQGKVEEKGPEVRKETRKGSKAEQIRTIESSMNKQSEDKAKASADNKAVGHVPGDKGHGAGGEKGHGGADKAHAGGDKGHVAEKGHVAVDKSHGTGDKSHGAGDKGHGVDKKAEEKVKHEDTKVKTPKEGARKLSSGKPSPGVKNPMSGLNPPQGQKEARRPRARGKRLKHMLGSKKERITGSNRRLSMFRSRSSHHRPRSRMRLWHR